MRTSICILMVSIVSVFCSSSVSSAQQRAGRAFEPNQRNGRSVDVLGYDPIWTTHDKARIDGTGLVVPETKFTTLDWACGQFVRSQAREWNIDKLRIGASGGSAGACSSLWLAFHDDMADPNSSDLIARESTRVLCAGVVGAQTSLDPLQMRDWIPNASYGSHAFGFQDARGKPGAGMDEFLRNRERLLPSIEEYSPYHWISADDSPVYLFYTGEVAFGKNQKDTAHTPKFGVISTQRLQELGVECHFRHDESEDLAYPNPVQFLIDKLIATKP